MSETDPQRTGVAPLRVEPESPNAVMTAELLNRWLDEAGHLLRDRDRANMPMLRGISMIPQIPSVTESYGLRCGAIACEAMYRGIAELVGMEVLGQPSTLKEELAILEQHWADFDFFYLHLKATDLAGENGDFAAKVAAIEEADRLLPRIRALSPDVLIVTGDHSTPAVMAAHSWHPVPIAFWSRRNLRPDPVERFGETAACSGGLGTIHATALLPLALAHAGRLQKYGA